MPKQREIIQSIVGESISTITIPEGKSAYEVAVSNGFHGTEQEWVASLKGIRGEDGVRGNDGYTPIKGLDYFDGAQGERGLQGEQGIQGIQGEPGVNGSDAAVTKSNVEAVLTGEITTHTHPGGTGGLTQSQILTRML